MSTKSEDRFKQAVISTLAKRAANRCSNPDCGAITSGPTEERSASVNVGEAAHIFGAHPGSARYDPTMASTARSDITNAVWLCGNCHKLIDDDEGRYPPGLLFEWVRQHEAQLAEQIGRSGAAARRRYEDRHLEEFGKLSYRAERIILEKPDLWEFRLTEEVLRYEMAPILDRWRALRKGLYTKPIELIAKADFISWIMVRQAEVVRMTDAFSELTNNEFVRAWGQPGEPGDEAAIVSTARLFAEMCSSALAWEEMIRFKEARDPFKNVLSLYVGIAGALIDEASKLPAWMADTFKIDNLSGEYRLTLQLQLPEGWSDAVAIAFNEAADVYHQE